MAEGDTIVKGIYALTQNFPKEEQYVLASQMKRAAISIPSNIAEGFRRRYNKEQKQFFNVALGSCAELETQILLANELGYCCKNSEQALSKILNHICGMLVNMCKRL